MNFQTPTSVIHRLLLLCLGFFLLGGDGVMAAQAMPAGQAINIAGRQRMLSQRVVKAYVQIGLGITPQVSQRQLNEAVTLFENQLGLLRRNVTDPQSNRLLEQMGRRWLDFKRAAKGPVTRTNAEFLMRQGDELLAVAHDLTLALQSRSGLSTAKLVDMSGRQRMLSQRMAKYYLARAWGIESAAGERELGSARAEFDGALAALRNAPENTPQIKKELEAVAAQWEWFKSALTLEGAASYGLVVAHASESILASMELVTALYEKLR